MPSAYTRNIISEEGSTFEEFIWRCARGMCPLIMQKDESLDAEIKIGSSSSYYGRSLGEKEIELEKLIAMGKDKWQEKHLQEMESTRERYKKEIKRAKDNLAKFEAMYEKTNSWDPPTEEHKGLKKLMLEQIEQGIRYDCNFSYHEKALENNDIEYTFEEEVEDLKQGIARAKDGLEEEKKSTEFTSNWLRELVKSVGNPPQNKKELFKDIGND